MSDKDLTRDQKIEKINAYRMLLKATLPLKKVEASLAQEIVSEFEGWIESRLNDLLGEAASVKVSESFSAEETEILRGLVRQIKSRSSSTSPKVGPVDTESSTPPPKKNGLAPKLSDEDRARLNANARPIKPIRPPANSGQKPEQQNFIDHLDKMDREGPEF